jgi:hypothetical protein
MTFILKIFIFYLILHLGPDAKLTVSRITVWKLSIWKNNVILKTTLNPDKCSKGTPHPPKKSRNVPVMKSSRMNVGLRYSYVDKYRYRYASVHIQFLVHSSANFICECLKLFSHNWILHKTAVCCLDSKARDLNLARKTRNISRNFATCM